MKKRLVKKLAKMYFGKGISGKYGVVRWERFPEYTGADGKPPVYKLVFHPHSSKLYDEINKLAGYPCHWDSPFTLEIDNSDLREWEEERCIRRLFKEYNE